MVIELERDGGVQEAWCVDPVDRTFTVRQSIRAIEPVWPPRLVCVVDTSAPLGELRAELVDWLDQVPTSVELGVVLAGDGARVLLEPGESVDSGARANALAELGKLKFRGGADDVPALAVAWDQAAEVAGGAVLWLHGAKPIHLDGIGELAQRVERRPDGPRMLSAQLLPGANQVLADQNVSGLFTQLSARVLDGLTWPSLTAVDRVRVEGGEGVAPGSKQTSDHLGRLWALANAHDLIQAGQRDGAIALAASYRLVTTVTGAVVLESMAQYQAAGLEPVEPGTVPSIPEPSFYVLLVAMAALLFAFRKRLAPAGSPG